MKECFKYKAKFRDLGIGWAGGPAKFRGCGSTGATGAWSPADIFKRVPGTCPEKIDFKRSNHFKSQSKLAKN